MRRSCRVISVCMLIGLAASAWSQRAPRSPLGVTVEDNDAGPRVVSVAPGSIADRSGFRAGDIILQVASAPAKTRIDVLNAVAALGSGTTNDIRIRREGSSS